MAGENPEVQETQETGEEQPLFTSEEEEQSTMEEQQQEENQEETQEGDEEENTSTGTEQGTEEEAEEENDDDGQENWQEKYAELERNYQRLERKFTKVTQQLSDAQQAINVFNAITSNPEVAEQVASILDSYDVTVDAAPEPEYDPQKEREIMRELLSKPDFVKYEDEIREWAEDNDLPFETAEQQKHAYLLWRGENVDRLIQEARIRDAKKAAKKQQAKKNAKLQKTATAGGAKPPDYKSMSDDEILALEGLSLWTDE